MDCTSTMQWSSEHTLCLVEKVLDDKKFRELKLKQIIAIVCALLNSNGGKVMLCIDSKDPGDAYVLRSSIIRTIEQRMISVIGVHRTASNINMHDDAENLIILIKKAESLITVNYNLYLPSGTQIVQSSCMEPVEKIKDIINRRYVPRGEAQLGFHKKIFVQGTKCGFSESKDIQFKFLKDTLTKRTRLADRITGKGNRLICYVSAFANHAGGHIYYGIRDDGSVEGELIPTQQDVSNLELKVEKVINKMIWPEHIGQPKRKLHWDISFESVVDKNFIPVPSTFVIVIYIAACLGGVFTEVPECYEMVRGEVVKTSIATWKKRIMHPVWLPSKQEIPRSVGRITWSSPAIRSAFIWANQALMQCVNNGDWKAIFREGERLEKKCSVIQLCDIKLLILSKQIMASLRRHHFCQASALLNCYLNILPKAKESLMFDVMFLCLKAAENRASGNVKGIWEYLSEALAKAELIEPGLITAVAHIMAASVADLINSKIQTHLSPEVFTIKALEHLKCEPDSSDRLADLEQRSYITLTTFYLCCNINGKPTKDSVGTQCLEKAKNSIMAIQQSICEGNPLSRYHEVQLCLAQSIYHYRRSQVITGDRVRFLRNTFNYAKKAERLAREFQFTEMVEWSKTNQALCTEELITKHFSVKTSSLPVVTQE